MLVVIFLLGLLFGICVGALLFRHPYAGALQVINDEDGVYFTAAFERDVPYIRKQKFVTMRIRELHNGYYEETQ